MLNTQLSFVLHAALTVAVPASAQIPPPCGDLTSCVDDVVRTAPTRWRVAGRGPWAPARLVRIAGVSALPALTRLLTHSVESVRESAAFALSLLGDGARSSIPDLARAARSGSDESLKALAHLRAPEALSIAQSRVRTSYAAVAILHELGEPGLQAISGQLRTGRDLSVLLQALEWNPERASSLVADLLALAKDRRRGLDVRLAAANLLADSGDPRALEIAPTLERWISQQDSRIGERAQETLARLQRPSASPAILRRLGRRDGLGLVDYDAFLAAASLGRTVPSISAKLVGILRTGDWETQALAAAALARTGDVASAGVLERGLRSPSWRVALQCARGLARVGGQPSLPALLATGTSHYHPAVRKAAMAAERAVTTGSRPPLRPAPRSAHDLLADDRDAAAFVCEAQSRPRIPTDTQLVSDERPTVALPAALRGLKDLRVFLPVKDGWLAGTDSGEWGGRLLFVPSRDRTRTLLHENVHYLARTPDGFLAITGLAHLSMNVGKVFLVRARGSDLSAEPLVELPSAPTEVWEAPGSTVVVGTELGELTLTPDGRLTLGSCRPVDEVQATLMQQVLDSPDFLAALAARKGPAELAIDGDFDTPPALRFRGRPVRIEESDEKDIRSGTRLEINGLEFPASGAARLSLVYPDLGIGFVAQFRRGPKQWELQALNAVPP
jgi:HEAT repeat protein